MGTMGRIDRGCQQEANGQDMRSHIDDCSVPQIAEEFVKNASMCEHEKLFQQVPCVMVSSVAVVGMLTALGRLWIDQRSVIPGWEWLVHGKN